MEAVSMVTTQSQTINITDDNSTAWSLVHTIVPPYIFIVCVTGILGNAFVLLVFALHKAHWTVPEIYLGNLALADLMLLASLPFWAMNILNRFNWLYGDFLCKAVNMSITVNMYTSIYLLMMVTVDRYLALVRTLTARWMRRTRYAKVICLVLWLFGFAMTTPMVIHRSVKYVPEFQTVACLIDYPRESWKLANHILMNLIGLLLPSTIIVFCNCKIVIALKGRKEHVFAQDRNDTKAIKLIYAVLLLFFICWCPFHLFTFLDLLCDLHILDIDSWYHALDIGNQFSTYLAFLNSCLNPVLYVFTGQYFRKMIVDICRRKKARSHSHDLAQQRSVVSTYLLRIDQLSPALFSANK
ncbi:B1 bradykinin receptor [Anguilla anguilla]|uniref:B1 bradykinin receptor n=1 Tax=Anguilla anguilla TaxID=7936 RepID=UPI0015ACB987|nr:B1 bradykinin receptor [Anguilla anguilla]XP_035243422.1 B1 bradykinin receptor [Anguilla anguilla]